MKQSRALKSCIIVIFLIMVLGILCLGSASAQEAGPHVIAGRVFDSSGDNPGDGYDGAYAAVIIEHKGAKTTYVDPDGIEQDPQTGDYWYVVTIPQGGWEVGDTYWIWVDGSEWGDENFTCVDHDDTTLSYWNIEDVGAEQPDVHTGGSNIKPLIAWIFAIILVVVGVVVGLVKPLKIPASGWPKQPADLTNEVLIGGVAEMPEEGITLPEGAAAAAAAAPAGEEPEKITEMEHICSTCGKPFSYIPEYDAWYCSTCQKYESMEETTGEAPPEGGEEEPPAPPSEEPACATCGGNYEWIDQYQRWFCRTCKSYAPKDEFPPPGAGEPDSEPPPPDDNEGTQPPGGA
ncbi:MAG: hypothetical protein JSW28_00505 [Thermoplasmata archaeon]|nr:MAG: hypothetical protein JSW28_00505 [Thermoplasmata archaeon]